MEEKIAEVQEQMNQRRNQLLGADPTYAYLSGRLSALMEQKEAEETTEELVNAVMEAVEETE